MNKGTMAAVALGFSVVLYYAGSQGSRQKTAVQAVGNPSTQIREEAEVTPLNVSANKQSQLNAALVPGHRSRDPSDGANETSDDGMLSRDESAITDLRNVGSKTPLAALGSYFCLAAKGDREGVENMEGFSPGTRPDLPAKFEAIRDQRTRSTIENTRRVATVQVLAENVFGPNARKSK